MVITFELSMLGRSVGSSDMHSVQQDDATLVERACAGDRAASERLFRRHAGAVLRLCVRLAGRSDEAEDIAQEALATAIDELRSLREPAAFAGWLRQITVRQAHRYFRRRKLKRWFGLDRGTDDVTLESLAHSESNAEQRAELAQIDRVLAKLDGDERVAWTLRVIEGEPLERVAVLCDCSLATVKRRISAAQARIDAALEAGGR